MKKSWIVLLVLLSAVGCNFSKSIHKDLRTGLLTKGDGLSSDGVYLSIGDETLHRNTFIYGEIVDVNFTNVGGFTRENGAIFPGMMIQVTNDAGESVLHEEDVYAEIGDGSAVEAPLLKANLTMASPLHSGSEYQFLVRIWDKKSDGVFTAEMSFTVEANEAIAVVSKGVEYDEIYLFSKDKSSVITSNRVEIGESTILNIEGLSGFLEEGGRVFAGLGLKATDSAGAVLLAQEDLFVQYEESGIATVDFESRLSAILSFTGEEIVSPVHCEITVFDKRSDARITARTELDVH